MTRHGALPGSRARIRALTMTLGVGLAVAACGGGDGTPSDDPSRPIVVTFEVVDERFKVLLTDPEDIATARRLLAGDDVPNIPNGRVVRQTGVNEGYGWSIDPDDFGFADVTVEVCDGLPSDVELGVVTSDRYCPWSAVVIAIAPAG